MKNIKTYFLTGLLLLVPLFILYQAITIVSAVVAPFVDLPLVLNFILGFIVIIIFGWVMIHIFKRRAKKILKRASKKTGWFSVIASGLLEFDNLSDRTHKAFRSPILYKVDDGIYKLGYITNKDISFIDAGDEKETEATPSNGAVWVYAPYPINFFGEMVLVDVRKVRKLNKDEVQNLPLFILSAGILQE